MSFLLNKNYFFHFDTVNECKFHHIRYFQYNSPATHPVRKQAALPAIMALTTILAMSARLSGARVPMAPIWRPMEVMLLNPQRAYVAIISERT